MKIYITGSVGSGKSTLARRAAAVMGIEATELDLVVYEPDPNDPRDDRKRTVEDRDTIFREILLRESWIMEDTGRKCFFEAPLRADQVVLLQPPAAVRDLRILRRWVRQRLGKEACGYRPSAKMLKRMFQWRRDYDSGRDDIKKRLEPFKEKLIILRSDKEVERWLKTLQ